MRHTPGALPCAKILFAVVALALCLSANSFGLPNQIAQRINEGGRFTLNGNVHPLAQSKYDQGRARPALKLERITLVLKPSGIKAADLDLLLIELQDPNSNNYHKWLTPESYARRFGASQPDIARFSEWLTAQGLTVTGVARARNAIMVSGTVDCVESAFQTEIHTYLAGGEMHYANATEPSVPSSFEEIVLAIHGLHDFRLRPTNRMLQTPLSPQGGAAPNYTSNTNGDHYLAPDDFATIFDIKPLYHAGIDGSDQTIVIVGQSRIDASHLSTFRSYFDLGDVDLTTTLVPDSDDPGTRQSDAQESDLDLEWASAVARGARLHFVYSYDVTDAVQYAIDENLAPVVSMSYGECETSSTKSDALTMQTWAKQANAQGITWVASSGDAGAAACYQTIDGQIRASYAGLTLAVEVPASIPEVTGVGGTRFNEGSGTYWNTSNDPNTKASAQSYIPEISWNDSTTNSPASSGGGVSQFFSKPAWQTGSGLPSDGARDVPDLAFPASADHDGYLVYTTSGSHTGWYVFGGTSAGAPAFSGVLALLNHYLLVNGDGSEIGLGNINARLYGLAGSASWAFHDITTGDNVVTATVCGGIFCSRQRTESVGYSAGKGYDQVTGLGSLDVVNFFDVWQK